MTGFLGHCTVMKLDTMELILTIKIYHSSFMQLFDNTGKTH